VKKRENERGVRRGERRKGKKWLKTKKIGRGK